MTPRSSVRAAARAIYGELAGGQAARPVQTANTLLADTPPQGGREKKDAEGGEQTDLTARVRALYEGSAVPVREIAKLGGVTERTIYKYVARGGWTRRYRVMPRGEAAAASNRGQRFQHGPGFAPAKGAGGRFIRRADKDKPFAHGLKATNPAARAQAEAACGKAARLAHAAQAQAEAMARHEALLRAINWTNRAVADLVRHRKDCAKELAKKGAKERGKKGTKHRRTLPHQERIESIFIRNVELALRHWQTMQGQEKEDDRQQAMAPAQPQLLP